MTERTLTKGIFLVEQSVVGSKLKKFDRAAAHHQKEKGRLNGFILLASYVTFCSYLLVRLIERYLNGGESWQQGDWLINSAAGPVRRGIGGDALIWVSDNFDLNLLFVVVAAQFLLFIIYIAVILKKSFEIGVTDRLLFLLLSPAFVGFYVNDFTAGFRKELIGLTVFLPLLYASEDTRKNYVVATVTALLFSLSVFWHEANVFLLPFLLIGLWLVAVSTKDVLVWGICAAVSTLAAFGAFAYAVNYPAVDDVTLMCQAVLDRGLHPEICGGAISYMSKNVDDTKEFVYWLLNSQNQIWFISAYMLAFVPIFLMLKGFDQRYRIFCLVCASTIFFLPLYFITIDWGRWLFMHISAITLILLISARLQILPGFRKPLPLKGFVVMLCFSAVWGIDHVGGGLRPGYPGTVERVVKGYILGIEQ